MGKKMSTINQELNDRLRKGDTSVGQIVATPIAAVHLKELVRAIKEFDKFNKDDDPYDEHTYGNVKVLGEEYLFKIDYYDLEYEGASQDPTDTSITRRVLTIMHWSEY